MPEEADEALGLLKQAIKLVDKLIQMVPSAC
jgi:hypothetical protein